MTLDERVAILREFNLNASACDRDAPECRSCTTLRLIEDWERLKRELAAVENGRHAKTSDSAAGGL